MVTCRAIGCEPYLAANLRSLPARGFHQWVEYCNAPSTPNPEGGVNALAAQRARNGDPEPFNVRHWGVGDEMWGCGGSQSPEEYGELYRRFTEWLPHFDGPASALRLIACGANGDDVPWVSCTIRVIGAPHAPYGFSAHYYTSGDAKIFVAGDALTFGATIFCFVTMSETSIPVHPSLRSAGTRYSGTGPLLRRRRLEMKHVAIAGLLLAMTASGASGQINAGEQKPEASLPFNMVQVTTLDLPWKIAFLPDGRMLITEKVGGLSLVTQKGEKTTVTGVPAVMWRGQGGMLGVYLSPHYAEDHKVYLTYSEPGDGGSSLALARATLKLAPAAASLEDLQVIWRDGERGNGGQFGAVVAFSPDSKYLFLTVGDRQRMTPAQDPNQPLGKILRLTLDGKPAPGNPMAGKTGAASVPVIDPPENTEAAKTAPVVRTYNFPGPNLTPSETWTSGHRTPYGLAFAPDGRLWELEHGPRGGDELNLIEPGKNYGWPLVSYAVNYDGVPIPSPDTRADLAKPVIYWTPVIAPGNLFFYNASLFPQWKGSGFATGLASKSITRITFDAKGGAKPVERWDVGHRVRDIEVAPDGSLWMIEDAKGGGLFHLTPK